MTIAALIGNPNVGKTTVFNYLTSSNYKVGNWAGVTVEKKEGILNDDLTLVDLPGIYALDAFSNEEKVAKDFLLNDSVDFIINVVDASNLSRNLYLTMELKKFNKPIILLLNMMDKLEETGTEFDIEKLESTFGLSIYPLQAKDKTSLKTFKKFLNNKNLIKELETDPNSYKQMPSSIKTDEDIYKYIDEGINYSIKNNSTNKKNEISEILDKVLLNRFLAFPIFFLILYLIFKFTFTWVGQPLSDMLASFQEETFTPYLLELLKSTEPWFQSLIVDGIVAGVGQVIVFLPVILALFLGISLLEDSGYMARTAFLMDKFMRAIGLSGKAFIPFIVGFGCSVPAIISSKTLESEKDRKLTALLVPFSSCNAKLPVYTLFASIFFVGYETEIIFSLYLLGILVAGIMGLILSKTAFKKDDSVLIIEIPRYTMPALNSLIANTFNKAKSFMKKAGTTIFAMSVLIWLLSSFSFTGFIGTENISESILASIGRFIRPIFTPLGFGTWQASVSLLSGLMAKEVVVGTLGVIYGSAGSLSSVLPTEFTSLSSYTFLVFVLLYTPCISVIATLKKEFGTKFAAQSVLFQFVVAWFVSLIIFNIGSLFF